MKNRNQQLILKLEKVIDEHYQTTEKDLSFWEDVRQSFEISLSASVYSLYTNEDLILHAIKRLMKVPFNKNSRSILSCLVEHLDPTLGFIKRLIAILVPHLEAATYCLNTLNISLFVLNTIFSQQTPTNSFLDSYVLQQGGNGIMLEERVRWPFTNSGTITLWFYMTEATKQCKLFELINEEKNGFEIVIKNKKIYFQKLSQEKGFRIRKSHQAYICDAIYNQNIRFCLQFQVKKRFFQPYFSINVSSNNFVMRNIEVDLVTDTSNLFKVTFFKDFYGKIYSILLMSLNLSIRIQQFNSKKGFMYENDIRNFISIVQSEVKHIFLLFTAIRARTYFIDEQLFENVQSFLQQSKNRQQQEKLKTKQIQKQIQKQCQIINGETKQIKNKECFINILTGKQNEEKILDPSFQQQKKLSFVFDKKKAKWFKIPKYTILFDAVGRRNARCGQQACVYKNISIKKEISNYGGLKSYLVFFQLLQINCTQCEQYQEALNLFLKLICSIFLNKTESIEEANRIYFFSNLADFLTKTKMIGFKESTLANLKQIYVSLTNRSIRESFIRQIVWTIPVGKFLSLEHLDYFVRFIKLFYNEDVVSALALCDIRSIFSFLLDVYDQQNCCLAHQRNPSPSSILHYHCVLAKYFSITENILYLKHADQNLKIYLLDVLSAYKLTASACFTETLTEFLLRLLDQKQALFEHMLIQLMQETDIKMSIFVTLAQITACRTKAKLLQLILKVYGKRIQFFQLLTLCIRYPTFSTQIYSIKSQDYQSSEEKTSMNSITMKKFVTIKPITAKQMTLLQDQELLNVVSVWGLKNENSFQRYCKQNEQKMTEQNEEPWICILLQMYKGSSYSLRRSISQTMLEQKNHLKYTPDLMAWLAQCLLISQFDYFCIENVEEKIIINDTKGNLLKLICEYRRQEEQQQQSELHIVKLVLAVVKSKYPIQVSRRSGIIFLLIFQQTLKNYLRQLPIPSKIYSNAYCCLLQYMTSHQEDMQFQEQSAQIVDQEASIALRIFQLLYQILRVMLGSNENLNKQPQNTKVKNNLNQSIEYQTYLKEKSINRSILNQASANRNKWMMQLLFPEKNIEKISLFCFIFVQLQLLFESFQDLNVQQRKITLFLIKDYLILLIQVAQNSGTYLIQKIQEQLKNIFTNTLGFLQNKFYQYQYYEFQRHKNLDYSVENKFRKNVEDMKRSIINCFIELIDLIKYVNETQSMQHKSFYDLMKPKKKNNQIIHFKNFFPLAWKRADQKILQYISLPSNILREEGREKFQIHLLQKRLASYANSIQKTLTLKIQSFIQQQKKENQSLQKISLNRYRLNEDEKCRLFQEYQQQITVLSYEHSNRQKHEEYQRHKKQQQKRRERFLMNQKLWHINRTYEGFWTNQAFYQYSQLNVCTNYYKRIRSARQSQYGLTPLLKIEATLLQKQINNNEYYEQQYLPQQKQVVKQEGSKSQKYLKIGLQFIKKKVIQKIMQSSLLGKEEHIKAQMKSEQINFKKTLLIEPMKIYQGTLKIDSKTLIYQHTSVKEVQHISLLKNKQEPHDPLIRKWPILTISNIQLKKFLLKPYGIEIFFKNRISIFFCFKNSSSCLKFVEILSKRIKEQERMPLTCVDPSKLGEKLIFTQMWKKRQLSNLDYLMILNTLSGRSNCDLNQYFVFPWILNGYESTKLKKDKAKYRDLQKNMGSLGSSQRTAKFVAIKQNIQINCKQQFLISHNYGFHYSNIAIVLQYLIRVSPYSEGAIILQGGKFDIPDRLFTSLKDSYQSATTETSDVRQLIPQFYYFPQMLINLQGYDFGVQQNTRKVNHVQLPDGYRNAYDFIQNHREELQSQFVSENLNKWIDLIFGYKQYGKEADLACNKFHYLTYENNLSLIFSQEEISQNSSQKTIIEHSQKNSIESQMAFYGKTPSQLFNKAHPKRIPQTVSKQTDRKYSRTNPFVRIQPILQEMIKHKKGYFSLFSNIPVFLQYSKSTRKYLMFRRDGQGVVFIRQKSQMTQRPITIEVLHQFNLGLDRHESVYIYDERTYFQMLPMCSLYAQHIFIGGLWGGRIFKYSVNGSIELLCKNSDTVSALAAQESLGVVVSGTIHGEIVIWEYVAQNNFSKMVFKEKSVPHSERVNKISINVDMKVAICAGQDKLITMLCLETCQILKVISVSTSVLSATLLTFPYYLFFIICANDKQYTYTLNGQLLQTTHYEGLTTQPKVCSFFAYREIVIVKIKKENAFIGLKMPEINQQFRIQINQQDNQVLQFVSQCVLDKVQITFNTATHLIWCSENIV